MDKNTYVKLPQMGEGVHEATLIKWFKKPGEEVRKDEPIVEVATDKVDTEIVATASGFLIATFAKPGDVIRINQEIGQISASADAAVVQPASTASAKTDLPVASRKERTKTQHSAPITQQPIFDSQRERTLAGPVRTSPLVRKLARESGVALGELTGSGLHGRVNKDDFYRYMQDQSSPVPTSAPAFSFDDPLFKVKTDLRDGKEFLDGVEVRREPMSRMRRLTAEHMLRSVRVSPHVTTTFEMDCSAIMHVKKTREKDFLAKHQSKLTLTAFFIHAAVQAIKEHPAVNASVDGDAILFKDRINIGCAIATENGLIVPVLKDANEATLFDIAKQLNDIVNRARDKRLSPEEIQGGTFSITNPGIFGSLHSQPIINQPQVAILSVGAIVERPIVVDGKIAIHPMVQVGLTFDHRVIDGEGGAKFLSSLRKILESYS